MEIEKWIFCQWGRSANSKFRFDIVDRAQLARSRSFTPLARNFERAKFERAPKMLIKAYHDELYSIQASNPDYCV